MLIGTTSVERSEYLSRQLKKRDIPHNVLNAKFHEQEAQIVAEAGRTGAVFGPPTSSKMLRFFSLIGTSGPPRGAQLRVSPPRSRQRTICRMTPCRICTSDRVSGIRDHRLRRLVFMCAAFSSGKKNPASAICAS